MSWSVVPILTAIVVGFVGFCLMVAAFVMVARQGGWRQAMQPEPDGRWSLPRRLMFAGALLGAVFGVVVMILFLIPGGIPWNEGSGWSFAVAVLPAIAAVWYFILRPAYPSLRPHQTAGPYSDQSNARSNG
jgi:amino acid transporter